MGLVTQQLQLPYFLNSLSLSLSSLVGETLTNAGLAAANPNKAVPAIDDNGFTMFERFHTTSLYNLRYLHGLDRCGTVPKQSSLSLVPRSLPAFNVFQHATLKSWEWPGDEARVPSPRFDNNVTFMITSAVCFCRAAMQ